MSETFQIILALMMMLCTLSLLVVCGVAINTVKGVAASGFRSQDRERRDFFQLIERLTEERSVTSQGETNKILELSRMHGVERTDAIRADAAVEQEAVKGTSEPPPLINTENMIESQGYAL